MLNVTYQVLTAKLDSEMRETFDRQLTEPFDEELTPEERKRAQARRMLENQGKSLSPSETMRWMGKA